MAHHHAMPKAARVVGARLKRGVRGTGRSRSRMENVHNWSSWGKLAPPFVLAITLGLVGGLHATQLGDGPAHPTQARRAPNFVILVWPVETPTALVPRISESQRHALETALVARTPEALRTHGPEMSPRLVVAYQWVRVNDPHMVLVSYHVTYSNRCPPIYQDEIGLLYYYDLLDVRIQGTTVSLESRWTATTGPESLRMKPVPALPFLTLHLWPESNAPIIFSYLERYTYAKDGYDRGEAVEKAAVFPVTLDGQLAPICPLMWPDCAKYGGFLLWNEPLYVFRGPRDEYLVLAHDGWEKEATLVRWDGAANRFAAILSTSDSAWLRVVTHVDDPWPPPTSELESLVSAAVRGPARLLRVHFEQPDRGPGPGSCRAFGAYGPSDTLPW